MTTSLAQALIDELAARGVTNVFGIPGVHNTELFRHFQEAGIEIVLPRHEQGAGFMADGYARASGMPGVCFVITGPGLTNAMTALGQAYSDSVPLIIVSTVLAQSDCGKGRGLSHDMLDQSGAIRSLGTSSYTLTDPGEVKELVARAFTQCCVQRPRPIHLQIPLDRLLASGAEGESNPAQTARPPLPARPEPAQAALQSAVEIIASAKRPVVIAGGGALDAADELRAFLDLSGAVIATTIAGKGVVPEDDTRSLGCTLPRRATRRFLESADLQIIVGCEVSVTDFGNAGLPSCGRSLRIDLDAQALMTNYAADVSLVGDAGATLARINALLPRKEPSFAPNEARDVRDSARREAHEERPGMNALLNTIRLNLPRNTIIASDMTEIAYLGNEVFEAYTPRTWLHPVGFGTLGYALPAGIGARLARPERPVACFIGDYGLQFTMPELATARDKCLPLVLYLWNNEKLHAIEKDMRRKQIEPVAVFARNPGYETLAAAYGIDYSCPTGQAELAAATSHALKAQGPSLIELRPANLSD
ncbi:5-guanidino-2-oxopentanoate decarboxylase [Limibacillus sp. MBR-115]|jgi:thiamine pyrophosphate-dependent acetolactate synthase large subunit-like protein|uniref:5-guanidino-2-oxopentanoate decarboxylase n=1 Tax=Limibacillus sp. MBR-115 TaxID=3156465 RepID=UPI003395D779